MPLTHAGERLLGAALSSRRSWLYCVESIMALSSCPVSLVQLARMNFGDRVFVATGDAHATIFGCLHVETLTGLNRQDSRFLGRLFEEAAPSGGWPTVALTMPQVVAALQEVGSTSRQRMALGGRFEGIAFVHLDTVPPFRGYRQIDEQFLWDLNPVVRHRRVMGRGFLRQETPVERRARFLVLTRARREIQNIRTFVGRV